MRAGRNARSNGGQQEPVNLDGSCKFASLFVKIAFGGVVEGAWGHQYNKVGGERVDLSAEEFSDMQHDEEFFGNEEHLDSLRSCLPRVLQRIHMLERELFERNYPDLFRGKALTTQRRDRDAEYRWAEKAQGTYGERYRMLHEALLEAGVRYDLRHACFHLTGVRVWHRSADLSIQRRVGLMKPLSEFTVKAETTIHDTMSHSFPEEKCFSVM